MTLGEIIKKYHKDHSLSMDDFAKASGISKSYISLLEKIDILKPETRFPCKFPTGRFHSPQKVLKHLKLGDIVELKETEWEGSPAFAVMAKLYGVDIGMIPANNVSHVIDLVQQYRVIGRIYNFDSFEMDERTYTGCNIELSCYDQ